MYIIQYEDNPRSFSIIHENHCVKYHNNGHNEQYIYSSCSLKTVHNFSRYFSFLTGRGEHTTSQIDEVRKDKEGSFPLSTTKYRTKMLPQQLVICFGKKKFGGIETQQRVRIGWDCESMRPHLHVPDHYGKEASKTVIHIFIPSSKHAITPLE